jgi:ABC-2 type transport system permease protein
MKNIWIVLKHELVTTLTQRSFWVMTFLFPAVVMLLSFGTQWIAQTSSQSTKPEPVNGSSSPSGGPHYSYVDQSGLIQKLPAGLSEGALRRFPDEQSAKSAIQAGEIEWYALIPADYLKSGRIVIVQRSFNPLGDTQDELFHYLLVYNLTGDAGIAAVVANPNPSTVFHDLTPQAEGPSSTISGPIRMLLPYVTLFLFFMLISVSSGLMLRSVSKEKSNRMAEVLLLSLHPRELMWGKLFGLSLVALLQLLVWTGGSMLLLKQGRALISGLAQVSLPPGFLAWAVVFFFLGFLLYASMMGAIGALAPDMREAGQFTFVLMIPLIVPMVFYTTFADAPNGPAAVALSMFPLTAPTAMITRLVSTSLPFWQPALSLAGLALSTVLIVYLSARFFRPETLLSSSELNWGKVLAEVKLGVTRKA